MSDTTINAIALLENIKAGKMDIGFNFKNHPTATKALNGTTLVGGLSFNAWLAYVSSKIYLLYGNKGAQYIPLFPIWFSKMMGGPSCFGENMWFNFYIITDTEKRLLQSHAVYQLKKEMGLPLNRLATFGKLLFSIIYGGSTAILFWFLSEALGDLESELITVFIHFILFAVGSFDFATGMKQTYLLLKQFRRDNNSADDYSQLMQDENIISVKELKIRVKNCLEIITSRRHADKLADIDVSDSRAVLEFLLDDGFKITTKAKHNPCLKFLASSLGAINTASFQIVNAASMLGYFEDNNAGAASEFNLPKRYILAVGIPSFIPFTSLTIRVMYQTTTKINRLFTEIVLFLFGENENQKPCDFVTFLFRLPFALLMMSNCLVAFFSSTMSLDLNHQYGFDALWIDWLTIIATMAFNVFGANETINIAHDTAKEKYLLTDKQRSCSHLLTKLGIFLDSCYDDDTVAMSAELNTPPLPDVQQC